MGKGRLNLDKFLRCLKWMTSIQCYLDVQHHYNPGSLKLIDLFETSACIVSQLIMQQFHTIVDINRTSDKNVVLN